ncbi:MAG TPA: carboxypeptidase-like regulatory domain-containing protein [Acidisarcina sp.]|nr:carboxypeptidase-like regulatory domain-containing protein [Acidisarcina sp.]
MFVPSFVSIRTRFAVVFVAALLVLAWTGSMEAQVVGGSISGTVRDPSGAELPGASVTLRNIDTGAQRILVTDAVGRYAAPSIPVGNYHVLASKDGFHSQVKTGITLVVGQSTSVDMVLPLGTVQEEVVVAELPPTVSLTTQQTSGLVDERQVKELPLNGRSYDELVTLNPGVVNYTAQRTGGVGTSNSSVGNMFAVSGHRPQENIFLLNGIEYTGASLINVTPGGTSGQLLGVDGIREFNVVTDSYGAEYGKRPGAQISIVTAPGTNKLHGSAFEFLRNSALDARNYFDHGSIPNFQRNQFGGSLGGPLRTNKLFLFGNYEGFRQNLGLSNVTLVPDNAARAAAVASVQPLLALWPVQNGPELGDGIATAYSHPLQKIREDFGTARFDQNISNADTLSAAYTIDDSFANTPSVNPLSSVVEGLREQVFSIQEQHVYSANVLNTARVGFSRAAYNFTGTTSVNVPGWVVGRPIGALVIGGGTALNGASQISLAGTNAGSNLTTARNLFTLDDHVFVSHRNHQLEAGVWLQRIQANDNLAQYQYGQASFSSLANFLQGKVSTFTVVPAPTELGWRSLEWAGFVQDTVKVRPNLEVKIGFRFESTDGWNEVQSRASNYLFDSKGVIETNPHIGSSALTVNHAKFLPQPRVGLAWDPFKQGKTIVHASFGMYNALLDNLDYRLDQTAPFNTTQSLKNVSVSSLKVTPGQPLGGNSLVSPSGVQPDAHTPTFLSYTLKVEQEIAPATSLSLGYVGSHGYHEMLSEDVNEPVPSILPSGRVYYAPGSPLANPALANTTTWVSDGVSSYNGLQADIHHRFSGGFQLRGVYTFSKSLDDGTGWNSSVAANAPGFVMYPAKPKLDWGPSTTDVRQLAVVNGSYELPFGRGKVFLSKAGRVTQKFVAGWMLSGIVSTQTGFPFTPQLGFNPTNNGDSRNPIRPSVNPAFRGKVILGKVSGYFDPRAFVLPAPGTYGNLSRNTLTGPGSTNVDVAFRKDTAVSERVSLQVRAEAFNVFNHTNLNTPNAVVFTSAADTPSPTAGVITSSSTTSRQIQFGAKILF